MTNASAPVGRYAVIVSRFPKLTETFVLQELRGLQERGLDFELYSIIHETPEQMQPDAVELDARANYIEWRSREVLSAQWHWLRRNPRGYLRAWATAFRLSWKSKDALVRSPLLVALAAAMARRMTAQGVDRVHAHWATYPTMTALCIQEISGIPYSFTGHAHDIFGDRAGLGTKVDRADLVMTCTDHGRGILVETAGNPTRAQRTVHLVHHGVRLGTFTPQPLRTREVGDPFRILCVAALQEYKGHRYLLEASALLTHRGVANTVTMLGDGELRAELEAMASSLGVEARFLGRQPSEVVRQEVTDADCFALASIQLDNGFMDGIPNVCVEAMAMGRPVVASSLPGIRELVIEGETGLLATSRDAISLADQLERLAADPLLAEHLAAAGLAKVHAEHDATTNLDEVHRLLTSLL